VQAWVLFFRLVGNSKQSHIRLRTRSPADGKIVALSPNSFIVLSHRDEDDSIRLAAYTGDSLDILWRSAIPAEKTEEVDNNSLFITGGNLVVFTNRNSNDTIYYRARLVDCKTGKAGEVRELMQAAPDEYASGLFKYGEEALWLTVALGLMGTSFETNHNYFKTEFSPDSSKLLLFSAQRDAYKPLHRANVNANILIMDRNLNPLKRSKILLLVPGDSGLPAEAPLIMPVISILQWS